MDKDGGLNLQTNEVLWAAICIGAAANALIVFLLISIRASIEAGTRAIVSELRDIELTIAHNDTTEQMERLIELLCQGEPDYLESVTEDDDAGMTAGLGGAGDALYGQAVALVCRERKASTSFVQRYLQIGYNRAARIIESMEAEGVISTANHVGKREVLGPGV